MGGGEKTQKFRAKSLIFIWQHHHFQEDTRKRFTEMCLMLLLQQVCTAKHPGNKETREIKRFLSATMFKHLTTSVYPSMQSLKNKKWSLPRNSSGGFQHVPPHSTSSLLWGVSSTPGDVQGRSGEAKGRASSHCDYHIANTPCSCFQGTKSSLCHRKMVFHVGRRSKWWYPAEHRHAHHADAPTHPGHSSPALTKGFC